ncbi:DUF6531 domain-containing protein [Streptomyces guryensis]|uniref:DUF6531 domain-containing protein n=1 Tax=Streptomyces guryensis TaxID=2886947 RepID=A0A9Q3VH50_9ACTN|nr:DUF6531 domain-containing protein [Streptomyces guryensis]MCD9872868.1 DUF6531 domain-containing protein [Streptomyces guryensis]
MTNRIVKALEDGAQKMGKAIGEDAGKAVKDFYHDTGTRLKKVAQNHVENDAKHAGEMEKILKGGGKEDVPGPHVGTSGTGRASGAGQGREQAENRAGEGVEENAGSGARRSARDALDDNPKHEGQSAKEKVCDGDPIDMATGRMLMSQTDIALPGTLPLVFTRTFESSFRSGGWFGPAWCSTLDQRLLIDDQGVIFVREDRSLLSYRHPAPGAATLPVEGERWPLEATEDGYTVTDPATGRIWCFTHHDGSLALLDQLDDRNGNWIAFDHDPATGAPLAIRHCGGYQLNITTDQGRITGLCLAGAAEDGGDRLIKTYAYNSAGQLIEVADPEGRAMRFGLDALGRITSWTDSNGSSYTYAYDERHRCVHQSGIAGHLSATFTYDAIDPETGHRVTAITDSQGNTTRYLINDASQVVAEISPLGAVTRFERDRYNRLLSCTDPLGHTTTFTYDEEGRLVTVHRADGRSSHIDYNALGLPVRITGFDGRAIRQTYDSRGNRTSLASSTGATTTYAYTPQGHVSAMTHPDGSTSHVRCNAAGMPLEITDPLGKATRYERDAFGRPITLTSALGAATQLRWTVEGKLKTRIFPDGHAECWTYDGEGNQRTHTDVLGQVTRFEYTHFDRLAARTGPDGVRHEFAYDTRLRLTQVTNPLGETWRYSYDADGRLALEEDFDGRVMRYGHDAAGRLVSRTTPMGQTVGFTRDALGRIVQKDVDGALTTYTYDTTDQLAAAVSPDVRLELQRDQHGRVLTETVNGRVMSFGYDAIGRRVSRTTPTGVRSSWTYDHFGNRVQLVTGGRTVTFTRDAVGRETSRTFEGGLTMDFAYDPLGRLVGHTSAAPDTGIIQSRAYRYRADGHLTGVDDQLHGPSHFTLDAVGRVTAVNAHNWSETYAYDAAGNQTAATWPDVLAPEGQGERTYTGTRIDRAGGLRYEYDAAGRTVLRQKTRLSRKPDIWRYHYNAEDQLTSVTTPDGTTWRYLYDPLGRRTAKQRLDAGAAVVEQVDFAWDGSTLCEETQSTTGVTLTWDHDGRRPVAQYERKPLSTTEVDERFFAIVTDVVGTPTELIDEHGRLAARTRTTLWGTTAWDHGATAHTPLRFPGQYHDAETGLHYNHHRIYDPVTARYLTPDPLGLAPAPNPASYVHNPHVWSDPLGLAPKECDPDNVPGTKRTYEEAKAKALRDAGIPEGAVPLESNDWVEATTPEWQGGKQLMDENHQPIYYTEEIYEHPNGENLIVFQDHHFGHQEPGTPGHQPAHVHVRPIDDTRNGQVPGAEEHYYYDRSTHPSRP